MLPAYIYGNLAMPVIVNLVDYFLMLLCLFVSISGIRFGNKLCKELESSMMSKQLIPTIKGVVFQGNVAAWTVILWGVGYNVAGRYLGNKWLALAYSGTVHIFCEPLICLALLKTKKDKGQTLFLVQ